MEANALHNLTAAYALDALDPEDAREYEMHLARCDRCRTELAALSDAASALAYATESPAPPTELRARILQHAQREQPNVVPLRTRWALPVAAAVAAVAACAALGLGLWAASLSSKLDRRTEALALEQRVEQILAQPGSRKISFSRGTLFVTPAGEAALILNRLQNAGPGRIYEAWVADEGAPRPAGLFNGGKVVAVPLEQPVRNGATVMVTEEKNGGTDKPSQAPFVTVRNLAS